MNFTITKKDWMVLITHALIMLLYMHFRSDELGKLLDPIFYNVVGQLFLAGLLMNEGVISFNKKDKTKDD